jgi:hypothetical protein
LASLGRVCNGFAVASTDGRANPNFDLLVTVITHELGHNFGAQHDTLIMNGVGSPRTQQRCSPFSINQVKVRQQANITPQCVSTGTTSLGSVIVPVSPVLTRRDIQKEVIMIRD